MSAGTAASLGSKAVESDPGAPEPAGEEPRPGSPEPAGGDWESEDEGPFFAWLPPEDRLWRHPSEPAPAGAPASPGDAGDGGGAQSHHRLSGRWSGLPRAIAHSTWAVALLAGLIGAGAATGVGAATGLWPHDTTVVQATAPSTSTVSSYADVGAEPINWTAVDDSVAASVVSITVQGAAGPQVGSGVVFQAPVDHTAYVVTANSLFARDQAAGYLGSIQVSFISGETDKARPIGFDALSGLAILKIDGVGSAVAANLGTVADIYEASQVMAMGSRAIPSLATGVSTGSVSGEDRTVDLANGADLDGLIALAIPPLSSTAAGGPVLDQFGQVVGITLNLNPINSADQQFTFAVPADVVSRVAAELIDGIPLTHPWLGVIDADDVPSVMARQLGLAGGVQVGTVLPHTPASAAGMQSNDIITSLGGRPVTSIGALVAQVSTTAPGTIVPITYVHQGRSVQTKVKMGEEPPDE
jgi:S1-C subfamily serine protease